VGTVAIPAAQRAAHKYPCMAGARECPWAANLTRRNSKGSSPRDYPLQNEKIADNYFQAGTVMCEGWGNPALE
jgi:hypothetical protein